MIDADAELMVRFREGDRSAFEQLFHRYTPPLVSFLARMVPERARAEELAQEVFVRIYQARNRYEPRARFSTFLFGIAHRLALNDLDRAHRKRERALDPDSIGRLADAGPLADEAYAGSRTAERVDAALAGLPARQRAALLLRVQEELGYDEIASILATTTASVKSLLHRARESLASQLEEEIS
jgi:RNA polymerase sigma-70 factor (ECF subfamily)